jgi:hypothetical protein
MRIDIESTTSYLWGVPDAHPGQEVCAMTVDILGGSRKELKYGRLCRHPVQGRKKETKIDSDQIHLLYNLTYFWFGLAPSLGHEPCAWHLSQILDGAAGIWL